jgi:predicted KAP-like P-loop ATPase
MSITSDQPIKKIAEDRFGRGEFSKRIAKVITTLEGQSSIVVSVNGPWGEGKTSILNMIEEELNRESKAFVIRFNPWRYSDEDQVLRKYGSGSSGGEMIPYPL